jgi:pteridine reductase
MELTGKRALVTGGAVRLGRALALALAERGADVLVHYHGSAGAAQQTAAEIRALGRRAATVQADLADAAAAGTVGAAVERELGGLDILVNSAATFERQPIEQITAGDWDRVMAVNVRAPFLLSRQLAPLLRATSAGNIVNIADLSALQPWPAYAHHAVSKAGLLHLTRVLARAFAPAIRVNAILPGTVLPPEDDVHLEDGAADRWLVSRAATPDDVARALLFLVTSEFVTGEAIIGDGGRKLL